MAEKPRVLLVEDDAGIRSVMADVLADEGYEVREAGDGYEALAVLDRWRPDLIVLDLMMPNLDGFGFRRAQRARPDARDIPILVVTARPSLGAEVEALDAAAVIPKPFDVDTLVVRVEQALRGEAA